MVGSGPLCFLSVILCGIRLSSSNGADKVSVTVLRGIGTYHGEAQTWKDAKSTCKAHGGKLLTIENIEYWDKLIEQLNVTDAESTIWVGGRDNRESWTWSSETQLNRPVKSAKDLTKLTSQSLGCYSGEFSHGRQFENKNQPELCSSFCKYYMKKPYAALQGSECYCLDGVKGFQSVLLSDCNTTCPGNRFEFCGGDNSATVYNTRDSLRWAMHNPDAEHSRKDCGQVFKKDNETRWYSGNCSQTVNYVCEIVDNPHHCNFQKKDIPCYYASVETRSWFEAAKICHEMGGHLANRDIERDDNDIPEKIYWTGLTRISQTWIGGSKSVIDPSLPRSPKSDNKTNTRLTLQRNEQDGSWSLAPRPCKEVLPFICRHAKNSFMLVDYTSRDVFVTGPEQRQVYKDGILNGILFIVIPSAAALLLLLLILIIICLVRRRNAKEAKKRKQEEHFYFILEKEESIYNTIDGLDMQRDSPCRGKMGPKDQSKTSKVAPKSQSVVIEGTYNQLEFKGRMPKTLVKSMIVHSVESEGTNGENIYDQIQPLSDYDTIEEMRKSCYTVVDKPYDRCGSFLKSNRDEKSGNHKKLPDRNKNQSET